MRVLGCEEGVCFFLVCRFWVWLCFCGESILVFCVFLFKGFYSKWVFFDFVCRNYLYIFCMSFVVFLELGFCGFGEGSGVGFLGGF